MGTKTIIYPDIFLHGSYVISSFFGKEHNSSVDVYVHPSKLHTTTKMLRDAFGISNDLPLSINTELPNIEFNIDYWVILPTKEMVTLDKIHQITNELHLINNHDDSYSIRFLSLFLKYKWATTTPSVTLALEVAEAMNKIDPGLSELLALKYANLPYKDLVNSVHQPM